MLRRSRIEGDDDLDLDGAGELHHIRLLVVNDDAHSCELIARLVESIGCRARRVHAADGIVEFVSDPMNEVGGVVLDLRAGVDASVPVLAGIRSIDGPEGEVPVIVLTSTADDEAPVWAAGGDAYLPRPFHADDFLRELLAVLQRSTNERAEARAARLSA